MKPVASTAEILAFKALNRNADKRWVDWAVDMLMEGFDTEYLVILAGMSSPFDQFEMQRITDKALRENDLHYSDKNKVITQYVHYLLEKGIKGDIPSFTILTILKEIYLELDYEGSLQQFYLLYYAKDDLQYSEDQWYVNGVDRNNIEEAIMIYFTEWLEEYSGTKTMIPDSRSVKVNLMTSHLNAFPIVKNNTSDSLPSQKNWWQRILQRLSK